MFLALFASIIAATEINPSLIPVPNVPREFRGAWVATVDNIDWPSKRTLSVEQTRAELRAIVDEADRDGINALLFQVRPSADALYASSLEPWSEFLTGAQGVAPNPLWDPLTEIVQLAHAKGIEVHAWINPFRVWHPAGKSVPAPNWIGYQHPEWVRTYGNLKWLDPGVPAARQHSINVIKDITSRYDVDGVHIDDYFYPYPDHGMPFPDDAPYQDYKAQGGKSDKQAWRRENVNAFISNMYKAVHDTKPWVKVGISPFGIYRPGIPDGIKAGVDQYRDMGSDPIAWLKAGQCDYMSPQLYWPIDQKAQSFPVLLHWWRSQNIRQRHLWPGLFTSRISPSGWNSAEVKNEIDVIRGEVLPSQGHCHFSFKVFPNDPKGIRETLRATYATATLVPECPWLAGDRPVRPVVSVTGKTVSWPLGTSVLCYVVAEFDGFKWNYRKQPASQNSAVPTQQAKSICIIAVGAGSKTTPSEVIKLGS